MAKVIASSVRKGNVLDLDGKLAVVIHAENIHPGKGTPVTHLEMRRIADGVKVTERYRTTDQVERAYLDDKDYNYLFEDDHGFTSCIRKPTTRSRRRRMWWATGAVAAGGHDVLGVADDGVPIAIELPARVTLEIVEADPVVKGQTASSSYKPAKLANGARIMVPPHIGTGTRVVIMTVDGSYVERAKD